MNADLKRKLSLATTITLSLFAVLSASVTTFAWFQATANATVTAESTSTTITVNKPDDYTFYGYRGNVKENNHTATGTFGTDFKSLTTSEEVNTYTSFDDMVPGDIKVFAIGVTTPSSVLLRLDEIISNNATKQNIVGTDSNIQERYVRGETDWKLNIGYAIDIFEYDEKPSTGSKPTGYMSFLTSTSGSDLFDKAIATTADRTLLSSGSYASPEIATSINFFNESGLSNTKDLYIFWSVVFSDKASLHYKEVTEGGVAVKDQPATGDRYFDADTSATGNSNCFAGLKFALTEFTLTIN